MATYIFIKRSFLRVIGPSRNILFPLVMKFPTDLRSILSTFKRTFSTLIPKNRLHISVKGGASLSFSIFQPCGPCSSIHLTLSIGIMVYIYTVHICILTRSMYRCTVYIAIHCTEHISTLQPPLPPSFSLTPAQ